MRRVSDSVLRAGMRACLASGVLALLPLSAHAGMCGIEKVERAQGGLAVTFSPGARLYLAVTRAGPPPAQEKWHVADQPVRLKDNNEPEPATTPYLLLRAGDTMHMLNVRHVACSYEAQLAPGHTGLEVQHWVGPPGLPAQRDGFFFDADATAVPAKAP